MELVVHLPLSGRALVEIRRSRAVVIAPGESCFDYGPFLQFWFGPIRSRLAATPSWERGGGVTLHVGKALPVCIIPSYLHILIQSKNKAPPCFQNVFSMTPVNFST